MGGGTLVVGVYPKAEGDNENVKEGDEEAWARVGVFGVPMGVKEAIGVTASAPETLAPGMTAADESLSLTGLGGDEGEGGVLMDSYFWRRMERPDGWNGDCSCREDCEFKDAWGRGVDAPLGVSDEVRIDPGGDREDDETEHRVPRDSDKRREPSEAVRSSDGPREATAPGNINWLGSSRRTSPPGPAMGPASGSRGDMEEEKTILESCMVLRRIVS